MGMLKQITIMNAVFAFAASMLFVSPAHAQMGRKGASYTHPTVTAEQAMSKVKSMLPHLTVGKSLIKTGMQGQRILVVTLVQDGQAVSWIRVNPSTGAILPKGMKVFVQNLSASQEQAANIVKEAIPKFELGSVRLRNDGNWGVDITLNKISVACVVVNGVDGSIVQGWKGPMHASNF